MRSFDTSVFHVSHQKILAAGFLQSQRRSNRPARLFAQVRLTAGLGLYALTLRSLLLWRLNVSTGRIVEEMHAVHAAPASDLVLEWSDGLCGSALCAVPQSGGSTYPCSGWFIPAEPRALKDYECQ
jgi:hypothetical protein